MNLPTTTRFKSSGSPQTGLSPTVNIRRVAQNNGAVVLELSDGAMSDIGDGLYLRNFGNFNPLYNYIFTFDARATSDSRYTEANYSGIQSYVDLLGNRGGGGGASFTEDDLRLIIKAIEGKLADLFAQFEIEVPEVIFDTSEIKDLIKQAKLDSGKTSKELSILIDKAAKKVEEIKSPKITTESVNTSQMEASIISKLKSNLEPIMKRGGDTVDDLLGDFAKWMMAETKKQTEGDRASIRAEERESLVQEFKNSLK